jgi:prepilin-type N-terminal cleavage/methylation domain-containing protein
MSGIKNQNGFTITEILVAMAIMALGFLAMAEMEFLSLRQKQNAEAGTIATNVIQFIADRDMSEVRRRYLYNSIVYIDAQAGRDLDLSYCDGSSNTSICDTCPCDPLEALTPSPTNGTTESTCAVVDSQNFDPDKLVFRSDDSDCKEDAEALIGEGRRVLYVVKRATTTQAIVNGVTTLTVSITYAVKTRSQFEGTSNPFSVAIKDSLATQVYQVTAHEDNYSDFLGPDWAQVRVPHVP